MNVYDMVKRMLSDTGYIEGIRQKNCKVIGLFDDQYFPMIKKQVLENNGTIDDAKDVMQEGMSILYLKVRKSNFVLSGRLSSFFYGICRNVWLHSLKKRDRSHLKDFDQTFYLANTNNVINERVNENRWFLTHECIRRLNPGCQKIIELWLEEISYEAIARQFNLANKKMARNKKYLCMKKLINLIKNYKSYKELQNEE